jgi:hypothetical protein
MDDLWFNSMLIRNNWNEKGYHYDSLFHYVNIFILHCMQVWKYEIKIKRCISITRRSRW